MGSQRLAGQQSCRSSGQACLRCCPVLMPQACKLLHAGRTQPSQGTSAMLTQTQRVFGPACTLGWQAAGCG